MFELNIIADPYAHVCFSQQSQMTEIFKKTVCPKWDQTMIFNNITIHGDPLDLADNLPDIVIEIFDYDVIGEHDFLGRAIAKPVFRTHPSQRTPTAILQWWPVTRGRTQSGELLASFELFLVSSKLTLSLCMQNLLL